MPKISRPHQYSNKRHMKKEEKATETIDLLETIEISDTANIPDSIDLFNTITLPTPNQIMQTDVIDKQEPVENVTQGKDVFPQNSLNSYQDCVEVIKPLKIYINRIGNREALLRLREVEKVVKYVIKNDKRPKKGTQNTTV